MHYDNTGPSDSFLLSPRDAHNSDFTPIALYFCRSGICVKQIRGTQCWLSMPMQGMRLKPGQHRSTSSQILLNVDVRSMIIETLSNYIQEPPSKPERACVYYDVNVDDGWWCVTLLLNTVEKAFTNHGPATTGGCILAGSAYLRRSWSSTDVRTVITIYIELCSILEQSGKPKNPASSTIATMEYVERRLQEDTHRPHIPVLQTKTRLQMSKSLHQRLTWCEKYLLGTLIIEQKWGHTMIVV